MTRPSVKLHPEYPFRTGAEDRAAEQTGSFLSGPSAHSRAFGLLKEFVILVHRFTFLERLMQGDVLYQLPVHLRDLDEPSVDPDTEGERLAEAERRILDWIGDDASALFEVLDEMGIKVLALEDRREGEPIEDISGAFYYEGPTGPALLVGTERNQPEAAFILAHEFAHLIADIDPYRARFCSWDARTLRNHSQTPEEARADRFARALLLPEPRLRAALRSLGGSSPIEEMRQLAAFFEVPESLVALRLRDLRPAESGAGDASREESREEVREAATAEETAEPPVETARLALPERFVNLALAAYLRGIMEVDELALFLRTSAEGAEEMLAWARINRPAEFEDDEEAVAETEAEDAEDSDAEGPDSPAPGR